MQTEAHNYLTSFPPDVAEATKIAWNRYQHILSERRQVAARARDAVQDAKKAGYATDTVRLAHRVNRMTPEKREQWAANVNAAAAQFGFAPLTFDESEPDNALADYLERMRELDLERKGVSIKLRHLQEAAEDNGVDFRTIKHLAASPAGRINGDDTPERREEWFHRFDKLATFLGWW